MRRSFEMIGLKVLSEKWVAFFLLKPVKSFRSFLENLSEFLVVFVLFPPEFGEIIRSEIVHSVTQLLDHDNDGWVTGLVGKS
jgi:hypothetical protein